MTEQPELDFLAPVKPSVAISSMADELPDEVLQIIGYLSQYGRHQEHPVSAKRMARALSIGPADGRRVRHLISLYQDRFPWIVCGDPGGGYYITDDPEAMRQYDARLYSLLQAAAVRILKFRLNAAHCGYQRHGAARNVHYTRRRPITHA